MILKNATFVFLFFLSQLVFSQDLISKKSMEIVEAKVLEISPTEIKFKKFNNINGPTFILPKDDIISITYENGTKEIYEVSNQSNFLITNISKSENMFRKGKIDAKKYYTGSGSGKGGVLAGSILSPLIGIIPAIATSASYPREINLDFPDHELMKNQDYKKGYLTGAKKIKQRKIWVNWVIGLGLNVVAGAILNSSN